MFGKIFILGVGGLAAAESVRLLRKLAATQTSDDGSGFERLSPAYLGTAVAVPATILIVKAHTEES